MLANLDGLTYVAIQDARPDIQMGKRPQDFSDHLEVHLYFLLNYDVLGCFHDVVLSEVQFSQLVDKVYNLL